MTNIQTTHYFRAALTALATILAATLLAGGVALAATTSFSNATPIQIKAVVGTGAKDLAGNALDQNPTKAGNQPKVWKFKVQ